MAQITRMTLVLSLFVLGGKIGFPEEPVAIQVHWEKVVRVSKTVPTLLVIATPPLRRNSPVHDRVFDLIKDLHAEDVRYTPWQAYPRLGIAELEPPTSHGTSWDFSLIDPMTEDVMAAAQGHSIVLNFSTIPQWMFKTSETVGYPDDPNQVFWKYEQGTELRDPTFHEAADYFARLVSWYVNGGFTDELGQRHDSGHHYKVDYWEVLNEPDIEHFFSPQAYTRLYDAVVEAVRKVAPQTRFVGICWSYPSGHPELFEYFLNPRNHQPGVPLDMISYHFYAVPGMDETPEIYPYTFFNQADKFLEIVGYIESIRQRLSPTTGTMVNEIGTMLPDDWLQVDPDYTFKPVPASYWNLSAAVYAYVFAGLARLGIDAAGESEITSRPGFFRSIAMLNWPDAQPNPRYHVLKLIRENFAPGDKMVDTPGGAPYVLIQGFIKPNGERKLLLVNKRNREFSFVLPEAAGGRLEVVDQTTGSNPPASSRLPGDSFKLGGLGVAVLTLTK
ncbi:MAG TPA: glycosyl hydrolase family 39 [Terriglobia bacterium]|nr:glycosyl hydrolase family 39 [Terriglobia bacterium]